MRSSSGNSVWNGTFPAKLSPRRTLLAQRPEARHWRYRVFEQLAVEQECLRIATGHTATDRAETLLYNLMRGSGADGLQALGWQRPISDTSPGVQVVRPPC